MKISVELSDSEIREIRRLTGENKKGPAIRKLLMDALVLNRRMRLADKFVSGEWGVDLDSYDESRRQDKKSAQRRAKSWRQ